MKPIDLKIMLPTRILVEEPAWKITAEANFGSFCLLPRHVDYLVMLAPGLFQYESEDGFENYLAVNGGTLVKKGFEVRVATQQAVRADDLGELRERVASDFRTLTERERKARTAMESLQANFVQKMFEVAD